MRKKQGDAYKQALQLAQSNFDKEVTKLAERIREEIIVPLCKLHGLTFMSGNGTFFFEDASGHYYDDPWPLTNPMAMGNRRIYNACKPVLLLLNEEVSHFQVLGYYVGDVK